MRTSIEPELIGQLQTFRFECAVRINGAKDVLDNVQESEKPLNRWLYDNICSLNLLAFRKDEGKDGLWSVEDQILFAFCDYFALWQCIVASHTKEDTMLDLLTIVKYEIEANHIETNDGIEICTEDEELINDLERMKIVKQEKAAMPFLMLYARLVFESEHRLALILRGSWCETFGLVANKINRFADIINENVPRLSPNNRSENETEEKETLSITLSPEASPATPKRGRGRPKAENEDIRKYLHDGIAESDFIERIKRDITEARQTTVYVRAETIWEIEKTLYKETILKKKIPYNLLKKVLGDVEIDCSMSCYNEVFRKKHIEQTTSEG